MVPFRRSVTGPRLRYIAVMLVASVALATASLPLVAPLAGTDLDQWAANGPVQVEGQASPADVATSVHASVIGPGRDRDPGHNGARAFTTIADSMAGSGQTDVATVDGAAAATVSSSAPQPPGPSRSIGIPSSTSLEDSVTADRPIGSSPPTTASDESGQAVDLVTAPLTTSARSVTAVTTPSSSTTTAAPTTADPPSSTTSMVDARALAALANTNPLFRRFSSVPSSALSLEALTEPALRPDNGSVGDGQFRVACQYSHFGYDDPIVFPGQPGRSHLHMFFGNTETDANTTAHRLLDSGGGSCNGFELNRSAYWVPALLDGRGHAVVPEKIILYYKTKFPDQVQPLPQGLKMISGSTSGSFQVSNQLYWSCGRNGAAYNKSNRIPECGGDVINATVVFPECWDGVNLDSADHRSHLEMVYAAEPCPAGHPVRLPQISILLYFPGQASVEGWHLSADDGVGGTGNGHGHVGDADGQSGGHADGDGPPGGSLHADWFGAWNDEALRLWIDGCMTRARNCSFGQTGTDRQLAALNPLQNHPGPYLLPLP